MNLTLLRSVVLLSILATPLLAAAAGLGELRGATVLGDRLRVEIDIIGADRRYPEASCFRLIRPSDNNDLPWVQKAWMAVRAGNPPVLEIRSAAILRDPIMQLSVQLGCGYEISRDYLVLAMPSKESDTNFDVPTVAAEPKSLSVESSSERVVRRTLPRDGDNQSKRRAKRRVEVPTNVDRLMLSGGGDPGDQLLRMATDLASLRAGLTANEAQRDILRLEFRTLMSLGEQASSQLATAEKLRNMEATLGDLQARAADFAARVEQGGGEQLTPAVAPGAAVKPLPPVTPIDSGQGSLSQWSFYGVLLGVVLGLAGWFGWRSYEQRRQWREDQEFPSMVAESSALKDDRLPKVPEVHGEVDIHFDLPETQTASRVDLELDGATGGDFGKRVELETPRLAARNSAMSIADATVDEHFEANPVMELADIMLSFGRVKGAAQALREYIDNNPQEALQPWIRLMDVYRMAGMRDEFEEVARNLNQHFNVEIQNWSDSIAEQHRPESLEELPRIMGMIGELWWAGDVVGYLYQLLRDNRGGKRAGFALPLVEEILFLIELKETSNRIEKKEQSHE